MSPASSSTTYTGPRAYNRADEYWSPEGPNANTYFLRSTDYIRLKTLQFGYNLPTSLLNKYGVRRLRFYVNGYNLLTWDKFKLMDPETTNGAGSYYPQTRVINIGMNLTF